MVSQLEQRSLGRRHTVRPPLAVQTAFDTPRQVARRPPFKLESFPCCRLVHPDRLRKHSMEIAVRARPPPGDSRRQPSHMCMGKRAAELGEIRLVSVAIEHLRVPARRRPALSEEFLRAPGDDILDAHVVRDHALHGALAYAEDVGRHGRAEAGCLHPSPEAVVVPYSARHPCTRSSVSISTG